MTHVAGIRDEILVGKPETDHWKDLGIDKGIILKWMLWKQSGWMWIRFRIGTDGRFL